MVSTLLVVAITAVILQSSQDGKGTLVEIRTMGFVIFLAGAPGRWPNPGLESVILPNHLGVGTNLLSFLWLRCTA